MCSLNKDSDVETSIAPETDAEATFLQDLINGKPIRKSNSLHKMKIEKNYVKVLVLYTGGTIGMKRSINGGL